MPAVHSHDFAFRITQTSAMEPPERSQWPPGLVEAPTLHNGDTIEIIPSKNPKGPSLDWLNLDLGYVAPTGWRAPRSPPGSEFQERSVSTVLVRPSF